ncbi:Ribonucleoprotein complex SRP, Srp19 component [Methanocaldococcus sp. FS406-22]|uniref:signal recognition particle subunit SRP19/SEC65 family protein n=1 Tax=Methanocaldococcus sp. (strain FS406-22) TaxID=644281 RepID=UPI0001BF4323|nr:signal recognition particle subunit SRP19/SEC65 family protein [Methanocaldococcus sp. FS406-22]ADC70322.1 Ribonucleoprotein complex SRP, Srp19 component [Methanocaldococcus sp. FS406-22]
MIIWPAYIDKKKSRKEGRRVPEDLAIENVKLKDIEKALKKLGLEPKVYRDKRYPRQHWEICGCIEVDYKGNKLQLLKEICKTIKRKE